MSYRKLCRLYIHLAFTRKKWQRMLGLHLVLVTLHEQFTISIEQDKQKWWYQIQYINVVAGFPPFIAPLKPLRDFLRVATWTPCSFNFRLLMNVFSHGPTDTWFPEVLQLDSPPPFFFFFFLLPRFSREPVEMATLIGVVVPNADWYARVSSKVYKFWGCFQWLHPCRNDILFIF